MDSVSDGSSESGRSAFSFDSLKEALEDLQMDTMCLLDLEPLLSDPILLAGREPVRPDKCQTWQPTQIYCDKISARFPEADERLIQRLGNANYHRYLRCQETRHRMQSEETLSNDGMKDSHYGKSSKLHDSGIGSSLPTTYADTVMPYGDNDIRKVRLPPLPAHAKDGVPFPCLCCGKLVSVRTNSVWKQHIYADLQPWICMYTECPQACETFKTQKDWVLHLALDHGLESDWMSIKCPLCRHDTGSGKTLVTKHLGNHLEEISLGALPVDCEFEEETTQSEPEVLSAVPESCEPEIGASSSHVIGKSPATLRDKVKPQSSILRSMHKKMENIMRMMRDKDRSPEQILQALEPIVRENELIERSSFEWSERYLFDDIKSLLKTLREQLSEISSHIATKVDRTSPSFPLTLEARTTGREAPAEGDGLMSSRNGRSGDQFVSAPAHATIGAFSLDETPERLHLFDKPRAIPSGTGEDEQSEPRYCHCNRASFGEIIACDSENCKREWFHVGCVGLKSVPPAHGTLYTRHQCRCEPLPESTFRMKAKANLYSRKMVLRRVQSRRCDLAPKAFRY